MEPTDAPHRVQLKRTRGWRMPPNTVKIDRSTRWGNPFSRQMLEARGDHGCRLCQVVTFEYSLTEHARTLIRESLAGKNVACWCALDQMCHGDILLAIANGHEPYLPSELAHG